MLVANPGQTPYSLISKKPCHNKPARNNAAVGSSIKCKPSSSTTITPSTSTVKSKTMTAVTTVPSSNEPNNLKTLSVRINRETDLLKHTVQKALISDIPSHFSSFFSLYTVPPTSTHRFPERTESLSVDSLKTEMCHFKPIRTVPTTPVKRSKAAIMKIPKAKVALKEEKDCDEKKKPKPSSNLSAAIVLTSPRVSAFSYVALIDKISTYSEIKQQHKTKSKSTHSSNKRSEENVGFGRNCTQARVLVKHIPSISSAKAKEELIPQAPVKHRTRRSTKALATKATVEQKNSELLTEDNMRVTRKRQQILRSEDSVPTKNAKLSKDCSKPTKSGKKRTTSTESRLPSRRSPPVTRSRLKQNMTLLRKQYQNNKIKIVRKRRGLRLLKLPPPLSKN